MKIKAIVLDILLNADNIGGMNKQNTAPNSDQPSMWLTVPEAATRLGLCVRTVYKMLRQGELPGSWKKRKSWRIPPAAVDAANSPPVPGKRLGTEA